MDYRQALAYIYSFTDLEKSPSLLYNAANYDLRRMETLLDLLGHPEREAPSIHIAGTKGKGSTAAMIASVLVAAGYRTGLYTSPHLHTLRERVQVDGQPIPEAALASLAGQVQPMVETTHANSDYGRLTTFEILTSLAFLYFREQKAQFQVLEAGLGGRLDATNVVQPRLAMITPISYDHMDLLGQTLGQIASEKAGIIKPGCPLVLGPQPPQALEVLQGRCQQAGAQPVLVGQDVTWAQGPFDTAGQSIRVKGRLGEYCLHLPLLGRHQAENAAAAVAALEVLREQGAAIDDEALGRGFASVRWPGRLEVLGQRPWLLVDGAHNGESARRLREAVADYFPGRRIVLVLGTSRDKDIVAMAQELAPLPQTVILTSSGNPRAAPLQELLHIWEKLHQDVRLSPSVAEAVEHARRLAQATDVILITGSLFVVAEARAHVLGLSPAG